MAVITQERQAGGFLPESITFRPSKSQGSEDGWVDELGGVESDRKGDKVRERVKFEIQTTETTNKQTDYIVIQVRKLGGRRSGYLNRKKNEYAGGKTLYKGEGGNIRK